MDINKLTGYTPEEWRRGEPSDNPEGGIRIVDVQDCTIATVWHNELDDPSWAEANVELILESPRLLELAKLGLELAEIINNPLTAASDEEHCQLAVTKAKFLLNRAQGGE